MIRNLTFFLLTIIIVTFLVITHTTITNLIWLSSMDMPVNIFTVLSSISHDIVSMNIRAAIPIGMLGLVSVALIIAFVVARIILIWVKVEKRNAYALAGAAALAALVLLMPLAFYNLDLIAGARSILGKVYLISSGALGGYFFGFNLDRGKNV